MKTPLLILLIASLLHFPFSLFSSAAEPAYRPVADFPQLPDGMKFGAVAGVEMDAEGNLLVFHRGKEPIVVLTPEGRYLRSFGAGLFDSAHGLRCDPEGAIWTTDNKNHTVVKFSPAGKVLLTLGKRDVKGEDTSHFNRPADIAFAKSGDIFIADGYGNSRVVRCDRNGKFKLAWGKKGVGEGEFDLPHAIRIDSKGLVYVGDRENDRIQVFNQEGKFIRQFGGFAPYGMHITPDDLLFVADGRANKVMKMTLTGEVLEEWGSEGSAPGQFAMPHGITVDKDGAVYVAEVGNKRIQKFFRGETGALIAPAIAGIVPSSGAVAGSHHALETQQIVAVENVCAWPNLTLLPDGTIAAILFNQPSHGQGEGDVECWASPDGLQWERRSTVTHHEPNTIRMNHAAGVARNGDLVVLCSGWTNEKQPERPKQAAFRDAVLRPWVLRSADGGRTWEQRDAFPTGETGWTEHIPFGDIWIGDDGALHTSCYQGEYLDPAKASKTKGWRSWHFRSDDDGWTWKAVSIIGPGHNETDIFPLGDKSWLAAARIDRMELIRSDDDGATWGEPQPVTERNEINGHLTRLNDGRLLLSYGVRVRGRYGVCAKLSQDNGLTWGEPMRLADATGDADCGYPSSVQRADGTIVTAWYSKQTPDHDGYHMGVTAWKVPAANPSGTHGNP